MLLPMSTDGGDKRKRVSCIFQVTPMMADDLTGSRAALSKETPKQKRRHLMEAEGKGKGGGSFPVSVKTVGSDERQARWNTTPGELQMRDSLLL